MLVRLFATLVEIFTEFTRFKYLEKFMIFGINVQHFTVLIFQGSIFMQLHVTLFFLIKQQETSIYLFIHLNLMGIYMPRNYYEVDRLVYGMQPKERIKTRNTLDCDQSNYSSRATFLT